MTRSVLFTSTAAAELLPALPEEEEEPPQAVALTISARASRTLKIRFILFLLCCCVLSSQGGAAAKLPAYPGANQMKN